MHINNVSDNNENLKRIRIYLYYTPFYREFQEKSNAKKKKNHCDIF